MADDSTVRLSFLVASLFVVSLFASWYRRDPLLDAIPTVGFSDPILSYFSAFRFIFDGIPMLKYGYKKTGRGLFKIATLRKWLVVVSSPELIEDVRKAPEDALSLSAYTDDFLQSKYTLDVLEPDNHYHDDVIRSKLTRNIADIFKDVHDELVRSLDASIPMDSDDWVKVPVVETMQRLVCAIVNRVFVGAPLCRDRDYQTLNLNFAVNVVKFASIVIMFPGPLKPIVARLLSNLPSKIRQEREFIRPLVEERFARMEEFGDDWDDKPNDMLMWLMSESKGVERSLEGVARRLLILNLAGINSTSNMFTEVLYRLLSNPEYIEPLRHEVETAVADEGWTKAGLDKMHKIDSFVRELMRTHGPGLMTVSRLAMRPFTFSNGITVPAGTVVTTPSDIIHKDGEIYPNPEEFDGFRFSKLRESNGVAVPGYQATSTSAEYLPFGYGRHACPSRFFVIMEIKAFLAHIVVTYDIKLEEGKQAPPNIIIYSTRIPGKANVMFRRRQK